MLHVFSIQKLPTWMLDTLDVVVQARGLGP